MNIREWAFLIIACLNVVVIGILIYERSDCLINPPTSAIPLPSQFPSGIDASGAVEGWATRAVDVHPHLLREIVRGGKYGLAEPTHSCPIGDIYFRVPDGTKRPRGEMWICTRHEAPTYWHRLEVVR